MTGGLGQQPLLLEHVAVRLERIAQRADRRERASPSPAGGPRPASARPPPPWSGPTARRRLEPGLVLADVVEQQPRLALERHETGQLPGARGRGTGGWPPRRAAGRRRPSVDARLERDLVDREAEVVEPPDPGPDGVPVAGRDLGLEVELVPDRGVARRGRFRRPRPRRRTRRSRPCIAPRSASPNADVLDEDVEVVAALAVGQATGGSRSSRRPRGRPGSCRRRAGTACWPASSRPSTRRRDAGRRAARPSRRAAGRGRAPGRAGSASAGGGTGSSRRGIR